MGFGLETQIKSRQKAMYQSAGSIGKPLVERTQALMDKDRFYSPFNP